MNEPGRGLCTSPLPPSLLCLPLSLTVTYSPGELPRTPRLKTQEPHRKPISPNQRSAPCVLYTYIQWINRSPFYTTLHLSYFRFPNPSFLLLLFLVVVVTYLLTHYTGTSFLVHDFRLVSFYCFVLFLVVVVTYSLTCSLHSLRYVCTSLRAYTLTLGSKSTCPRMYTYIYCRDEPRRDET